MDTSRLRQRIGLLKRVRNSLENRLIRPRKMIVGSIVQQYTLCGKPMCACHRDPKKRHGPYYYLSYKEKGRSKYEYLGKEGSHRVIMAKNYQGFQRGMASLGKIHKELMGLIWRIGEEKIEKG